jgi:hypothetical protein
MLMLCRSRQGRDVAAGVALTPDAKHAQLGLPAPCKACREVPFRLADGCLKVLAAHRLELFYWMTVKQLH